MVVVDVLLAIIRSIQFFLGIWPVKSCMEFSHCCQCSLIFCAVYLKCLTKLRWLISIGTTTTTELCAFSVLMSITWHVCVCVCVLSVDYVFAHICLLFSRFIGRHAFGLSPLFLYCFCHFSLCISSCGALSLLVSISAHFCRLISDYKASVPPFAESAGSVGQRASTRTFDCLCACVPNRNCFTWFWLIFELSSPSSLAALWCTVWQAVFGAVQVLSCRPLWFPLTVYDNCWLAGAHTPSKPRFLVCTKQLIYCYHLSLLWVTFNWCCRCRFTSSTNEGWSLL